LDWISKLKKSLLFYPSGSFGSVGTSEGRKNFIYTYTPTIDQSFQDLSRTGLVPFSPHNYTQNVLNVRLSIWNCRSLSKEKLSYLLSHNCDINLLQEVWQLNEALQLLLPNYLAQLRTTKQGGGTLVSLQNFAYRCHRSISINQDCNIYRLILGRDKIIWIGSIYLSMGTPAQLKSLFKNIYEFIPPDEWKYLILGGDFNIGLNYDIPKRKLLETLTKQFSLQITCSELPTTSYGKLDYLIHGSGIKAKIISANISPSDHRCLIYDIEIPCPERKPVIRIPNRVLADKMTFCAWKRASNSKEFLQLNKIFRRTLLNKVGICESEKESVQEANTPETLGE